MFFFLNIYKTKKKNPGECQQKSITTHSLLNIFAVKLEDFVQVGTWSVSTVRMCTVASAVSDSATPWTVVPQAPLSMGFSRQEHWSGVAMSSSRGSSWPRDWTRVSLCFLHRRRILYRWATGRPTSTVYALWMNHILDFCFIIGTQHIFPYQILHQVERFPGSFTKFNMTHGLACSICE